MFSGSCNGPINHAVAVVGFAPGYWKVKVITLPRIMLKCALLSRIAGENHTVSKDTSESHVVLTSATSGTKPLTLQ